MKTHLNALSMICALIFTVLVGCQDAEIVNNQKNELVAVAGEDRSGKVNEEILLDGSGSHDKNNKPFTYLWSIKTKPQGSMVLLASPTSVKTAFTPDVAGVYLIQLQIAQTGWTAKDELVVVATADPGTPVAVILEDDIDENTTLEDIFEDPSQPDYIVVADIQVKADLTIMPGVVVLFEEKKGLEIVSGSIRAIGNSTRGILLKGMDETPGYWKGIVIHSNSEWNEFEYVTVQHAGAPGPLSSSIRANVTLAGTAYSGAALNVNYSTFVDGGGYGLYVQGSSSLNGFRDNAFLNNSSAAAYIPAGELHKLGTTQFGVNGFNGIETGGLVQGEQPQTWKKLVYMVSGDIAIGSGVSIEAGAIFKIKNGMTIGVTGNGYLTAVGTEAAKIIFTSYSGNGNWNGLYFNSPNSNNRIQYAEVSNAGMNKIAGSAHQANIVIGEEGKVEVRNSMIKNGPGFGVVAKTADRFNSDIVQVNTFSGLQKGAVFPVNQNDPDKPSVEGVWVDQWTFNRGVSTISNAFYNEQTGVWFGGAARPWDMTGAGFGIGINEDGAFIWTAAENSPIVNCVSYSAEYMRGTATITPATITFDQSLWRSKFVNSCDETQNVDTSITPQVVELPYEINKKISTLNGETYWELKFNNPDGSSFSYYRR